MSRFKRAAVAGAVFAGLALATTRGSIISSFDVKIYRGNAQYFAQGLTYGAGYIWTNYWNESGYHIVTKRNPQTGSIVTKLILQYPVGATLGWDNTHGYLYEACAGTGVIWWNASTGSFVGSFKPPLPLTTVWLIDYNEGAPGHPLWLGEPTYAGALIVNTTTAGSVVSTFNFSWPGGIVTGLSYDRDSAGGPFLYVSVRHYAGDVIAVLRPATGSVISSFVVGTYPVSIGDLSWDGNYIWCLGHLYPPYLPGYACRVVAHEYPAIASASLGKIKALFQ